MSKKVKAIIAGSIVIVLLVAALLALVLTKKPETKSSSSLPDVEVITLFEGEAGKLEYAKIKNSKDEYTIELLGEKKWGIKALEGFAQLDSVYTEAVSSFNNVYASEIIEKDCNDFAKFGLDKPSATGEFKYKGKEPFKITLGDLSPDGYTRYAVKTGEKTVYGLSATALNKMLSSRYEYLDNAIVPALEAGEDGNPVAPKVDYIKLARTDLEKPIVLEKYKEGELTENSVPGTNLKMTSPINCMSDDNTIQTNFYAAFGLSADKAVMVNPTADDLKKYGLDKPSSTFEMNYNETMKFKIITGGVVKDDTKKDASSEQKEAPAASYYVMLDGRNVVYEVAKDKLKWLDVKTKDVMSAIAVLPSIIDIKSVDLNVGSKSYNIKYLKGADKTDTKDMKASVNGKNVDIDAAKKFLQLLYMTSIQDVNTVKPSKAPDLTVKYNYENNKSDLVEFYVLEDRQIVISLNGNLGYIGRSGYTDKVNKEILNLVNGKKVDTDW